MRLIVLVALAIAFVRGQLSVTDYAHLQCFSVAHGMRLCFAVRDGQIIIGQYRAAYSKGDRG